MTEASMLDLTRGLAGFHRRDLADLEVDIEVVDEDPDDEAFAASWLSDGRIEDPYELSPSEVIALAFA